MPVGPFKPSPTLIIGSGVAICLNNGGQAWVDLSDIEDIRPWAWRSHENGSGNLYASTRIAGKTVYLHRLLLKPGRRVIVDHIDGDGLNCRRNNLRLASNSQNQMNRRTKKAFKGVYKYGQRELWYAKIREKKLGYFKTPEEAARAYDAAARLAYGEFARCNFESHGCSV